MGRMGVAVGPHAASHQNGGSDEVNVAALSGELADDQPPKAHSRTVHSDIDQSLLVADDVVHGKMTIS